MSRRNYPTDLQKFFQRTPFLAGYAMLPEVQGVMDLSLEWPLKLQPKNFDYVAVAGANRTVIAAPQQGTHLMVAYALFTTSVAAVGQQSTLFIQQGSVPTAQQAINLQVVRLIVNRNVVPLVNTNAVADDGLFLEGIGAVYLPFPFQLVHTYGAAAGGENCTLRTGEYAFPETQPLSTIIEF